MREIRAAIIDKLIGLEAHMKCLKITGKEKEYSLRTTLNKNGIFDLLFNHGKPEETHLPVEYHIQINERGISFYRCVHNLDGTHYTETFMEKTTGKDKSELVWKHIPTGNYKLGYKVFHVPFGEVVKEKQN